MTRTLSLFTLTILALCPSSSFAAPREQVFTDIFYCGVIQRVEDGDTAHVAFSLNPPEGFALELVQGPDGRPVHRMPLPDDPRRGPQQAFASEYAGENPVFKIRFQAVDTPEFHPHPDTQRNVPCLVQPGGAEARAFTEQFTGAEACVFPVASSYDRVVGAIYLRRPPMEWQNFGIQDGNLSSALVRFGFGHWYSDFTPAWQFYGAFQEAAQRERLGLWAGTAQEAPWDYRRRRYGRPLECTAEEQAVLNGSTGG